jgi:hypothetical protein
MKRHPKYPEFKILETDEEAEVARKHVQNLLPGPPTQFPQDYYAETKEPARVLAFKRN